MSESLRLRKERIFPAYESNLTADFRLDLRPKKIASQPHHMILHELRFSCFSSNRRELELFCAIDLSLQTSDLTSEVFCMRLSLPAKSRFPGRRD